MNTTTVIGGYVAISIIIYFGSVLFPKLSAKFDGRDWPPISLFAIAWPLFLMAGGFIYGFRGLSSSRQFLLDLTIERQQVKEIKQLEMANKKQRQALIDIVVEEKPTNYRHADCQGCGRPLT